MSTPAMLWIIVDVVDIAWMSLPLIAWYWMLFALARWWQYLLPIWGKICGNIYCQFKTRYLRAMRKADSRTKIQRPYFWPYGNKKLLGCAISLHDDGNMYCRFEERYMAKFIVDIWRQDIFEQWEWLIPGQKSGVNISGHTMAIKNHCFRRKILQMLSDHAQSKHTRQQHQAHRTRTLTTQASVAAYQTDNNYTHEQPR